MNNKGDGRISSPPFQGGEVGYRSAAQKCSFVGAGLAPALTEPQDLIINFEGNKETKPFPVQPGRGQAPPLQIKHFDYKNLLFSQPRDKFLMLY